MFEGVICGTIVFAIGYVGLVRVMARRADVLHGAFIQPDGARDVIGEPSAVAMIERYLRSARSLARR